MGGAGALDPVFRENQRYLWSLCYRMTGSAADSEDLVQETFERALSRPPARTDQPWLPWLVRVALNLSRDHLRRRRRRAYVGPWLPSPVETDEPPDLREPAHEPVDTVGRYELLESVSYAFLIALEALTPAQRAVLLLRDVLDYTARETGVALDMSDANVRTTHHRARRAMRAYDTARCVPTKALKERTREMLSAFLVNMALGDVDAMEKLLVGDVVALSDSGGRYLAARLPVTGANKVARLMLGIRHPEAGMRFAIREVNGLPALVAEFERPGERIAPRFVLLAVPDSDGRISGLHTVLAPEKLTAVSKVESSAGFHV